MMRRSSQVLQLLAGVALIVVALVVRDFWTVLAFGAGLAAIKGVELANREPAERKADAESKRPIVIQWPLRRPT